MVRLKKLVFMGGHADKSLFIGLDSSQSLLELPNGKPFKDNLEKLTKRYPLSSKGYFGAKGKGKSRIIKSENPVATAWDFALNASYSPMSAQTISGKGIIWTMRHGERISFRYYSSSDGSPVIELNINDFSLIPNQKIHFVYGKEN